MQMDDDVGKIATATPVLVCSCYNHPDYLAYLKTRFRMTDSHTCSFSWIGNPLSQGSRAVHGLACRGVRQGDAGGRRQEAHGLPCVRPCSLFCRRAVSRWLLLASLDCAGLAWTGLNRRRSSVLRWLVALDAGRQARLKGDVFTLRVAT